MKPWKIAISLAVIGAISAPFVAGSWRPRANADVWIALTAKERSNLSAEMERSKDCRVYDDKNDKIREPGTSPGGTDVIGGVVCHFDRKRLADGGHWTKYFSFPRYLATNCAFILAGFVGVFTLAIVTLGIIRRYWEWLRA